MLARQLNDRDSLHQAEQLLTMSSHAIAKVRNLSLMLSPHNSVSWAWQLHWNG